MRYEDCPACVKREVLEHNINFWCSHMFLKLLSESHQFDVASAVINTLLCEYIALCPLT